jgi:FkbM family methyltransferase
VAGATTTPTVGVWTRHHPVHFFEPADNVLHLVPADHAGLAAGAEAVRFFEQHYRYRSYKRLFVDLPALVEHLLTGESLDRLTIKRFLASLGEKADPFAEPGGLGNEDVLSVRGIAFPLSRAEQDMVIVQDIYINDAYRTTLRPRTQGKEVVVDVGAHIGCFTKLYHERNPDAELFCVEACPENLPWLVGEYATILHAACTYEAGELALLNAVFPDCDSTGGSIVVPARELDERPTGRYWADARSLPRITIHELMERYGIAFIDVLKLDCEGSEFSILEHAPLDRIGFIYCESHDAARWRDLLARKFAGWDIGHMSANGNFENWHLANLAVYPRNGRVGS